jgi:hypothetical protein
MSQPEAGWYPDPSGDATKIRWWDGNRWTDDVRANTTTPSYDQSNSGYSSAPSNAQPAAYQQPATYQQPAAYQTTIPGQYVQPAMAPVKDNKKLALAGFICAMSGFGVMVLSFTLAAVAPDFYQRLSVLFGMLILIAFVMVIPTIILSAMGLKSSKRGLAIAGLIMGILGALAACGFIVLVIYIINTGVINYY